MSPLSLCDDDGERALSAPLLLAAPCATGATGCAFSAASWPSAKANLSLSTFSSILSILALVASLTPLTSKARFSNAVCIVYRIDSSVACSVLCSSACAVVGEAGEAPSLNVLGDGADDWRNKDERRREPDGGDGFADDAPLAKERESLLGRPPISIFEEERFKRGSNLSDSSARSVSIRSSRFHPSECIKEASLRSLPFAKAAWYAGVADAAGPGAPAAGAAAEDAKPPSCASILS